MPLHPPVQDKAGDGADLSISYSNSGAGSPPEAGGLRSMGRKASFGPRERQVELSMMFSAFSSQCTSKEIRLLPGE